MKRGKKKLLSVLLALCLLIAFLPAGAAWAEDDTTPPEWASGYPQAAKISDKEFSLKVKSNEDGKAYYVRLDHNTDPSSAPSAAQVKAGQDASGTEFSSPQAGSVNVGVGESSVRVKGLTPDTSYDVYTIL